MYRYVIVCWCGRDPNQATTAASIINRLVDGRDGWMVAAGGTEYALVHRGVRKGASETLVLPQGRGAVCGKLFAKHESASSQSRVEIDDGEAAELCRSGGQRLIDRYWGRYVAVLRSRRPGAFHVLRDPSGGLPAYMALWQGVHLVFSDVIDILSACDSRPTINWAYVAALVARRDLQDWDTGLNEISEIQPGECVTIGESGAMRSWYWRPDQIAPSGLPFGSSLGDALRETTRTCIQRWASCYAGVLHRLSGGLDSSIVLSCLATMRPDVRVTCLNEYVAGAAGDEREFARMAARHYKVDLVERHLDPRALDLRELLAIRPSPRPWFYLYSLQHTRFNCALARERGAGVVVSGSGGDALFYRGRVQLAAIDFARTRGRRPALFGVALDAARVERTSVWRVLRDALWLRGHAQPLPPSALAMNDRTLVRDDVLSETLRHRNFVPPALRLADTSIPGKWAQMRAVAIPPGFYDPLGEEDDPETVMPLMSQPLIELCLSIPTYVAIAGGRDRAVARLAFEKDVPGGIIRRRNKGSTTGHVKALFERNLPFIRELLLNGALIGERILDRDRLEATLSRRAALTSTRFADVLIDHVTTEVWIQRWSALRARRTLRAA